MTNSFHFFLTANDAFLLVLIMPSALMKIAHASPGHSFEPSISLVQVVIVYSYKHHADGNYSMYLIARDNTKTDPGV